MLNPPTPHPPPESWRKCDFFGIFGVSLESINKDTEKVQPKNDIYEHPMFKPVEKKELEVTKSNIKAPKKLFKKVSLPFYRYP